MQKLYSARRIFTGSEWLSEHVIEIEKDKIISVFPKSKANGILNLMHFPDCSIVPGFIDVQVYGAGGRLLSAFPDEKTLEVMHSEFLKQGTILCQPTVSTNTIQVFKKCIDAIRIYCNNDGEGIYGLHMEGPWLNKIKKGAHKEEWIHAPQIDEVRDILEYGKGVITMITIAPENVSDEVVALIRSYGIVLSAGHSNATFQQAINSFNKGIEVTTHLYNAMSSLHHREPGLVGAAMTHPGVRASIIPDGNHVNFEAISIAKKLMCERLFVITDAVTETSTGPYQHQLQGDKYVSDGVLSGSAISIFQGFKNLVTKANIEEEEALRMCTLYPAQVLHCDHLYGKIAEGYIGKLVVLDKEMNFMKVI